MSTSEVTLPSANPDAPNAVEYVATPDLPEKPTQWKRRDVQMYLKAKKDEYDFDDDHIDVFQKNEVGGRTFMKLTSDELEQAPFNFAYGTARCIADLINAIKSQVAQELHFQCVFKYGRETKTVIIKEYQEHISVDLLCRRARFLFEFPEGTLPSDLSLEGQWKNKSKLVLDRTHSSDAHLRSEAASGSLTISISTTQRPFSCWTFNEFKAQFKIEADNYGSLPRFSLPAADLAGEKIKAHIDDALKEVMKIYKICPDGMTGNESNRSLFVFEILKQATSIYDGFHLKSQKHISGNLGSGPADFAIEHAGTLIMVTEAKRENIDQGVAQCAIQLDCSGKINKKRRREQTSDYKPQHLYGIVTTGNQWVFMRLEEKPNTNPQDPAKVLIEVHKKAPVMVRIASLDTDQEQQHLCEDITALFDYILRIYQEVKDNMRVTKRQRVTA